MKLELWRIKSIPR